MPSVLSISDIPAAKGLIQFCSATNLDSLRFDRIVYPHPPSSHRRSRESGRDETDLGAAKPAEKRRLRQRAELVRGLPSAAGLAACRSAEPGRPPASRSSIG